MAKQISYIDYYINEKCQRSIGFLRGGDGQLEIVLRNVPIHGTVERNIYLMHNMQENKRKIGKIILQEGTGQVQINIEDWKCRAGEVIYIPITSDSYGLCIIDKSVEKTSASTPEEEKREMIPMVIPKKKEYRIEPVSETDKWRQICKNYPNVHIFPQTQAVLIKPKDIIILHRDYHGLATNSFLLHAYYNYRQLLLCRNAEDERYYLKVPGVYYEREVQLAALYGFTEFENGETKLENGNQRELYAGCFGYYKKYVEI
ncbi:MAG: hypothetical protein E7290_02720 [Lachnospiraceae bacterium]|nr:hypothetical protein [Lachnospiraceae bacterium]